jgi:RNA polymerase sigma factor (sigma-70 family)
MANLLRQRLSPSEQRLLQMQLAMFWYGRPLQERNAYANILVFLVLKNEDVIAPAALEVIVHDIVKSPGTRLPWSMDGEDDFRYTVAAAVMDKLRAGGAPQGQARPWRHLVSYQRNHDPCTGNFRAWIRRVAFTTAIDLLRRNPMSMSAQGKPRWIQPVPLDELDEADQALDHWRAQTSLPRRLDLMRTLIQIADRLHILSQKDWDILRLRVDSGLGYRQIAELLGCTPEAVRKRLTRARQRLLQDLDDILKP